MSQPLLLIYGQGGHQKEMALLVEQLVKPLEKLEVVTLGPQPIALSEALSEKITHLAHLQGDDVRDKHSRFATLLAIIPNNLRLIFNTLLIYRRFQLAGVISTGPGLAILPMLILRVLGIKTVFVETYCRFSTRSMTGRVMSKIAHRFLVQNKPQVGLYDNAEYCGRL